MSRRRLVRVLVPLLLAGAVGGVLLMSLRPTPTITVPVPARLRVERAVTLPVVLETGPAAINAAEVYLTFDPAALRIERVGKEGSFLQLWVEGQPTFSNETGVLSFAGGLPTPGFSGRGTVGTVNLTPLTAGTHWLSFSDQTQALLNDGQGTVQPLRLMPIKLTVVP